MHQEFNCPNCRIKLRVNKEKDFTKGRCPNCGSRINIPQGKKGSPKEVK